MTNKEIAKKLNISPSALSLILNHKPGVSAETRSRVIQQLDEMGYSHLVKLRESPVVAEQKICFVIYKKNGDVLNQNPFFLLLMESIETQAKKHGFSIMLTTIDNEDHPKQQIEALNHRDIQGVLIMATEMTETEISYFSLLEVPYVAMDHNFSLLNVSTVAINNQMGTYQAIEYLVEKGHTDIGYVQSMNPISSWQERTAGYRSAMQRFGLMLPENNIFPVRYSEEGSYQDFKKLLQSHIKLPSALVSDDDVTAVGVMRALAEHGFRIPEDISIIGFNDRPCCKITTPQLTSIDVPKYSFGVESVDSLIRLIAKSKETNRYSRAVKILISTQLIARESVRNLKKQS